MNTPLLEIRLFGSFGVWQTGQPLPPLRARAEKWLLMLLALRPGKIVSRDWLSATLWPDSETLPARYNLRRCLTSLRKALGTAADRLLTPTPQTLCLDRAGVWVDVTAFDAALGVGSIESLEQGVALYRGPLLEDCHEEWALTARIEREHAYLAALETLAAHSLAIHQPTAAVRYLRLTVAADPLREAAHNALMQALADCGDYAALTQVYRDLRLLLHRELNVAPSAETDALFRRLQQQGKQMVLPPLIPSSMPPRRLPVPLTNLVGRETDIAEVIRWLQKERLVTLLGSGGVGKTRLAIAAAEDLVPTFPDGVWFVELASLTDPTLVAHTVARTLGVKEETGRPLLETLAEAAAPRSLLLILDNCEHLLDACAALADALLSRGCALRVLATSREALGLMGEHRHHTSSLALPPIASQDRLPSFGEKDLAWLMEYGGMRLFVERAMQAQPSYRLTAENAASVLGIVRHLDGIPLAIELAAARVRSLSVAEIQNRLSDRFALLGGGHRTALPRHQTLRALVDWSYDLLNEQEKILLLRLSVFAGGWSLEAAERVCVSEGMQERHILDVLTALVDKSLVAAEAWKGTTRYHMLETMRQYAAEKLQESGAMETVNLHHRDWFLALAERAEPQLKGPEQQGWLERLETEHDNLRLALVWSETEAKEAEAGLRLAGALWKFWEMHGYYSEGRLHLARALEPKKAQEWTAERAKALNGAGVMAWRQGDYMQARSFHAESLFIKRGLGDRQKIADSLNNLALVVYDQGDYTQAQSLHEESLAIYREIADTSGLADALNNLGLVKDAQGDYVKAQSLYAESLALQRQLGNKSGITRSLFNLGNLASAQGNYAQARPLLEESLTIRRELGDTSGIAYSLNGLGIVAYSEGDYVQARPLFEESLRVQRELGDKSGVVEVLNRLAGVLLAQGERQKAVRIWAANEALRVQIGELKSLQERAKYDGQVKQAQTTLGEATFASVWEEGYAMAWESAVAYALGEMPQ